jgi:hypothetical protein
MPEKAEPTEWCTLRTVVYSMRWHRGVKGAVNPKAYASAIVTIGEQEVSVSAITSSQKFTKASMIAADDALRAKGVTDYVWSKIRPDGQKRFVPRHIGEPVAATPIRR